MDFISPSSDTYYSNILVPLYDEKVNLLRELRRAVVIGDQERMVKYKFLLRWKDRKIKKVEQICNDYLLAINHEFYFNGRMEWHERNTKQHHEMKAHDARKKMMLQNNNGTLLLDELAFCH